MRMKKFKGDHASQILSKLNRDRKEFREHCDVTIRSGDGDFPLHKCVLVAFCGLDWNTFTTNADEEQSTSGHVINLKPHRSDILEIILEFIYTCEITITDDNVTDVLSVAEELKIPHLEDYSVEFLCDSLNAENCLKIQSYDEILRILQMNENKTISDEILYSAVIGWINHDVTERESFFPKLFEKVKLKNLSTAFLQDIVRKEGLVWRNPTCLTKAQQEYDSRVPEETVERDAENDKDPITTNYPEASLYVGNLHRDVTSEMLGDKFMNAGKVKYVHLGVDKDSGESRGFAFVNFIDVEDAKYAIEELNFDPIKGRPMHITWSQYDPSLSKSAFECIFVKNLDESVTNEIFYEAFSEFGYILSCKVSTSKDKSLRYGFVHYMDENAAVDAITKMNGNVFCGSKISVDKYVAQEEPAKIKEDDSEVTKLFIKNFSDKLNEEDLKTIFQEFGEVDTVTLKTGDHGNSLGCGFVNFKRQEDAQRAIDVLNSKTVEGGRQFVGRAQVTAERQKEIYQPTGINMGVRIPTSGQMIELSSQTNDFPGGYFMQFQGSQPYMPSQIVRAAPPWQHNPNPQFQMGTIRTPPVGPAIRPMTTPVGARGILPSPYEMMQPHAAMQYNQGVHNSAWTRYTPPIQYIQPGYTGYAAQQQPDQQAVHVQVQKPLSAIKKVSLHAEMLAAALPHERKQMLGECLYPLIEATHADLASKITGMLLVLDNSELLHMLESPESLKAKVEEAVAKLHAHQAKVVADSRQTGSTADSAEVPTTSASPLETPKEEMKAPTAEIQEPLTATMLASVNPKKQKQMLGERLYPLIEATHADLASKITGMLLEIDNSELLHMLDSPESRKAKIKEAVAVLHAHQAKIIAASRRQSVPPKDVDVGTLESDASHSDSSTE